MITPLDIIRLFHDVLGHGDVPTGSRRGHSALPSKLRQSSRSCSWKRRRYYTKSHQFGREG
jgi:hypothetical protein